MRSTATRRALVAGLFASAPAAALAQVRLPHIGLPPAPRLPFIGRGGDAPPPAPKLSGKRPDLAAILKEGQFGRGQRQFLGERH